MAIVHPAFCGIVVASMEPIENATIIATPPRLVDTKHCKNRVYSPRSADVFSTSTFVAQRRLRQPIARQ
jgi:hypothetical protein